MSNNTKVTLVSVEAGAAHACELANGLEKYVDLTTVYHHVSAYGIDDIHPGKIGLGHIPKSGDTIIVVGLAIYEECKIHFKNYRRVVIVIPDGPYMRKQDYFNEELKNFDVFTTNCKYQFATFPVKEFYQPFDIDLKVKKDVLIGHSVFAESKKREKGTDKILMYDVKLIKGLNWRDNLKEKARCEIFVDQIGHFDGYKFGWNGGIGKSGLEAMLLDCLVICRGEFEQRELPVPPIAWCTYDTFEDVLIYYISHPEEREKKVKAQKKWALKYLNKDYCAKRILNLET